MKNRWIGGLALAMAMLLGACAPPNQGAGESPSAAPTESAEAMESTEASEGAEPPPADDEY